jgi:hypothetical protein
VRHVARRQRERDIDRLHRAIDAVERKPQRARSHIIARQHMRKRMHETTRERDDRFLGKERLEQITQRVIDRRRDDGDERFFDAAERLVDPPQQFGRKTRGKRRARLVEQRTDGFEAEPAQRPASFRCEP